LVKRIKKRVPKKEEPEATAEELEPEEIGLNAELESIAEDEFTEKTAKLFQWLLDRRWPVLGAITLGAVLLFGIAIYQRSIQADQEAAAADFFIAQDAYQKIIPEQPDEEISEAEREAAIKKARDAYESTLKHHSSVAALAELGQAGAEFELGRFGTAIKLYDSFLSRDDLDPFSRVIALQGKAKALENKGDRSGAISSWENMKSIDPKIYGLMASLQIARLLELEGQEKEALSLYKKLLEEEKDRLAELPNRKYKLDLERSVARLEEPG